MNKKHIFLTTALSLVIFSESYAGIGSSKSPKNEQPPKPTRTVKPVAAQPIKPHEMNTKSNYKTSNSSINGKNSEQDSLPTNNNSEVLSAKPLSPIPPEIAFLLNNPIDTSISIKHNPSQIVEESDQAFYREETEVKIQKISNDKLGRKSGIKSNIEWQTINYTNYDKKMKFPQSIKLIGCGENELNDFLNKITKNSAILNIDISNTNITKNNVTSIVDLFKNSSLKTIIFENNTINSDHLNSIIKSLPKHSLLNLSLNNTTIGDNGVTFVANFAENNEVIKEIHLDNCGKLSSGSVMQITAKAKQLDVLSLKGNNIQPDAVLNIRQALRGKADEELQDNSLGKQFTHTEFKNYANIKILDLSNNPIGGKWIGALLQNTKIEELYIDNTGLISKDLSEIKKATETRKIKQLSISHNQIGELSAEDLFYINAETLIASNCGMSLSEMLQKQLKKKAESFMENRPLNFDFSGNSFNEGQKKTLNTYMDYSHSKVTF